MIDPSRPMRWLPDPWDPRGPIPLDGVLERPSAASEPVIQVLAAFVVMFIAIVAFQVISLGVSFILLLGKGVPPESLTTVMMDAIDQHGRSLLTANTVGQVLGLALPALILMRMHSSRGSAFIRLRRSDLALIGLSVLALACLTPVVQWLGHVNSQMPLPEFLEEIERSQMELIEKILMADTGIVFNLVVLALTPAICEELLFRGYVQRQAERGLGAVGGIAFSGIFFGIYHLRLTQVLPLTVLGLFLAYLVWRTGSLWPAIIVHFANNAFAVMLGAYAADRAELQAAPLDEMEIPWYFVLGGLLFFAGTVYAIQSVARTALAHRHPHHANRVPED